MNAKNLAATVDTAIEQHDDTDHPDAYTRDDETRQDAYQVTTHALPVLEKLAWTTDSGGLPPRDLVVSSRVVRVWLSHAGGLSFRSERPRLAFSEKKYGERRERLAVLLRSLPLDLDPTVTDDVVVLDVDETARLQEWAGPPAPGARHKWAANLSEYAKLQAAE